MCTYEKTTRSFKCTQLVSFNLSILYYLKISEIGFVALSTKQHNCDQVNNTQKKSV